MHTDEESRAGRLSPDADVNCRRLDDCAAGTLRLRLASNAVRLAAALLGIACTPAAASAESILFVGNSFTFGAESPVQHYRPETVTDLNHERSEERRVGKE